MDFLDRIRAPGVALCLGLPSRHDYVLPGVCSVQGDQNIANQAGAAFRSDLNNELQALATISAGTAAPGTTYRNEYWDDTTNNVTKKRNAANAAWLVKATLDETFVLSRSSNTILGLSDIGKTIVATSTFTQTLTAAATLGDDWGVLYRNDGTGIITLDPNGAETIDGATTLRLYPGESCLIKCNGTAFKTIGRQTGWVKISSQTASSSATIDFTTGLNSDFDSYEIRFAELLPATDATDPWLRISQDTGSTFKAGATNYKYTLFATSDNATNGDAGSSTGDSKIKLVTGVSNNASRPCEGVIRISGVSGGRFKMISWDLARFDGTSVTRFIGSGMYAVDGTAIDGLRLLMSSGNIATGYFTLHGLRK